MLLEDNKAEINIDINVHGIKEKELDKKLEHVMSTAEKLAEDFHNDELKGNTVSFEGDNFSIYIGR